MPHVPCFVFRILCVFFRNMESMRTKCNKKNNVRYYENQYDANAPGRRTATFFVFTFFHSVFFPDFRVFDFQFCLVHIYFKNADLQGLAGIPTG